MAAPDPEQSRAISGDLEQSRAISGDLGQSRAISGAVDVGGETRHPLAQQRLPAVVAVVQQRESVLEEARQAAHIQQRGQHPEGVLLGRDGGDLSEIWGDVASTQKASSSARCSRSTAA